MSTPARQLQQVAATGSAVVMAVGIVLFGWPTFTVLALYWLENVIIGGFTALRILAAGGATGRYGESLATTVFFCVHYGLFCAVHGIFVATLFGGIDAVGGFVEPLLLMIGRIAGDRIGLLVVAAMVAAAAIDAWQAMAAVDADDARAVRSIMAEPYGRIVVLHVVLIAGGFLMAALDLPSLAALLLVAVKLLHDLRLLRRRTAQPKQGTAGDAAPP
ncbi:MAG: hypothetical protein IPM30_03290 [Burkholderiales bacterium]|nr:hypothetical protein [Burkholderiales bacterium]